MSNSEPFADDESLFHEGELAIQTRTGKQEQIARFARHAIRPFMPDQHREFFEQLPFMAVGAVDEQGWPWASLFAGKPRFIQSPTETSLNIMSSGADGDPVKASIKPGAPLGLLGIELHTRRRNRLNGRVSDADDNGFSLTVDQSFGNCPKYIQHRDTEFIRDQQSHGEPNIIPAQFDQLDDKARDLIKTADTFFVSSFIQAKDNPKVEGVDVSHRGGRPGFVKIDGNTLTIPDFTGNYLFNTLGNFLENPKAGLTFPDFTTGDMLMMTGAVEILWEDHEEVQEFEGALRAWRFTLDHGLWLRDALPFRSKLGEFSPHSLSTGTWQEAITD